MNRIAGLARGQARDALIYTGSTALNRLGTLLLVPLYWARLSPSDYGVIAVIAIIAALQTLFGSLALDLAITRFYYEWPEADRRRNLGAIWIWNWAATLIVGAAFLLLFRIAGPVVFPDTPYDPWLVLGIVGNTLANLFLIPASTVRIKRRPGLFAAYNLGSLLATVALGVLFVVVLDLGLRGYLLATILASLCLAVVGGVLMLRFAQPAVSSPGLREALRFSLPAIPSSIVGTVTGILDRFLLSVFAPLSVLGLYSVALSFVGVIGSLHTALKMAFGPFMMESLATDPVRGARRVAAATPNYLVPYFALALALSLFIGPFTALVGQEDYADVAELVPLLSGIYVLGSLHFYYSNGLFLGKRTELLAIPVLLQLLVLVVTSVLLIGPFMLPGLIASRYAAAIAFFAASLVLSQRVFALEHRWASLLSLAALTIAVALTATAVALDGLALTIAFRVAAWALFLVAAVWVVRRTGEDEAPDTSVAALEDQVVERSLAAADMPRPLDEARVLEQRNRLDG